MTMDSAPINLTHHFLIAMPGLMDESFARSVVYMCEHSERGALGLIINKPSPMRMEELFEKVDLNLGRTDLIEIPVLQGGPVHTERGFVLHEPLAKADPNGPEAENTYASTLMIPGGLEMTLGYAAWAQGQLESELAENSWLTVEADAQVIFDTPIEHRYDSALALLGLQAWMLSPQAGHA